MFGCLRFETEILPLLIAICAAALNKSSIFHPASAHYREDSFFPEQHLPCSARRAAAFAVGTSPLTTSGYSSGWSGRSATNSSKHSCKVRTGISATHKIPVDAVLHRLFLQAGEKQRRGSAPSRSCTLPERPASSPAKHPALHPRFAAQTVPRAPAFPDKGSSCVW